MRKCEHMGDWYIIERAEADGEHREWMEPTEYGARFMHSARLSDADVEGPAAEMLDIAAAIGARRDEHHKRCAVAFRGGMAHFFSPRNSSEGPEPVTLADADALAEEIRATLGPSHA
jgi:hypothetical protein